MDRKFVEFRLGSSDISAVRFGISLGYELVHAVRVILRPGTAPLHWGWFRTLAGTLPDEAFRLMAVVCGPDGYLPDFLTATSSGDMTPGEEAARLRQVPDERLLRRREDGAPIGGATGRRRSAASSPSPVPPGPRSPPPGSRCGTRCSARTGHSRNSDTGLAEMAGTLHSTVTWAHEVVRVRMRRHEEVVDCGGTGLVLVPSVMAATRGCAVLTEPPAQPTIFYPAHGVSESWHYDGARALDALTACSAPPGPGSSSSFSSRCRRPNAPSWPTWPSPPCPTTSPSSGTPA